MLLELLMSGVNPQPLAVERGESCTDSKGLCREKPFSKRGAVGLGKHIRHLQVAPQHMPATPHRKVLLARPSLGMDTEAAKHRIEKTSPHESSQFGRFTHPDIPPILDRRQSHEAPHMGDIENTTGTEAVGPTGTNNPAQRHTWDMRR